MMKSIEKLVRMGFFLVAAILSASAVYADDFEGSETSLVEAFKAEGANALDLDSNENAFRLVNAPEGILVVLTRPPSKRTLE